MKQSTLKANQLVDAILTEDERWINVPDTYQDDKPSDFVMKFDCSKLQVKLRPTKTNNSSMREQLDSLPLDGVL
jgi:hypothetical protein